MSYLKLHGVLVNVYTNPSRKKADGSATEEKDRIQLLGDVPLENGGTRKDLINITVSDGAVYENQEGTEIIVPVGVMAPQKGTIVYYLARR